MDESDTVRITPAMVAAGIRELHRMETGDPPILTVKAIYRAMRLADLRTVVSST